MKKILLFIVLGFNILNTGAVKIVDQKNYFCVLESTDVIESVCYDPNYGYMYYFVKDSAGVHYKIREKLSNGKMRLVKNLNTNTDYYNY